LSDYLSLTQIMTQIQFSAKKCENLVMQSKTSVRSKRAANKELDAEPRRLVRRSERRVEIINFALNTFRNVGIEATMGDIARAASTTESTLFYVFQDRADLLRACIARIVESADLIQALQQASVQPHIEERLTRACMALRHNMCEAVPLIMALASAAGPAAPKGSPPWDFQPIEQELQKLLHTNTKPNVRWRMPVDELASELMGLLFASVVNHILIKRPLPPMNSVVKTFLYGAVL
jgi:AcrR family transcriptional regulator